MEHALWNLSQAAARLTSQLQQSAIRLTLLYIGAGKPTVNNIYGTRTAVLAGDYLFAQSSWLLARLQNFEVQ